MHVNKRLYADNYTPTRKLGLQSINPRACKKTFMLEQSSNTWLIASQRDDPVTVSTDELTPPYRLFPMLPITVRPTA
jgi:hypothetical protein